MTEESERVQPIRKMTLRRQVMKYGALRTGSGIKCSGAIEAEWLHITWQEALDGVHNGPTEQNSSTNTGLTVMKRIVMSGGGEIDRNMTEAGLTVRFSIPHRS